jgi:hypothetical protein
VDSRLAGGAASLVLHENAGTRNGCARGAFAAEIAARTRVKVLGRLTRLGSLARFSRKPG